MWQRRRLALSILMDAVLLIAHHIAVAQTPPQPAIQDPTPIEFQQLQQSLRGKPRRT
jgi:hypothetical protein